MGDCATTEGKKEAKGKKGKKGKVDKPKSKPSKPKKSKGHPRLSPIAPNSDPPQFTGNRSSQPKAKKLSLVRLHSSLVSFLKQDEKILQMALDESMEESKGGGKKKGKGRGKKQKDEL